MSLALGAFLAGVVIGESDVSHQVGAEVLPFREIFAAIFFVSVGMLVNPAAVVTNAGQVLALTAVVILGKGLLTLLLGLVLPASGRTILVVAAGLGQIGEFSFLVGQAGLTLGVVNAEQYGLILAAALLSIVANPLLFRVIPWIEATAARALACGGGWTAILRRLPCLRTCRATWSWSVRTSRHIYCERAGAAGRAHPDSRTGHAASSRVPPAWGSDAGRRRRQLGNPYPCQPEYGALLVVTISDENAAELIVAAAHEMAPNLRIIAREATRTAYTG